MSKLKISLSAFANLHYDEVLRRMAATVDVANALSPVKNDYTHVGKLSCYGRVSAYLRDNLMTVPHSSIIYIYTSSSTQEPNEVGHVCLYDAHGKKLADTFQGQPAELDGFEYYSTPHKRFADEEETDWKLITKLTVGQFLNRYFKHSAVASSFASLSAGDHDFKKGDRVIVRIKKNEWYTGTVKRAGAKAVKIDFDDGADADVEPADFKHIKPMLKAKKSKKPLSLEEAKALYTAPAVKKTVVKKIQVPAVKTPVKGKLNNPLGRGKWRIYISNQGTKWACEVRDHPTTYRYRESTTFDFASADAALKHGMGQLGRSRFRIYYFPNGRGNNVKPIQISATLDTASEELKKAIRENPPSTKAVPAPNKPTKKPNVGLDPKRIGKQIPVELYLQCGDEDLFEKAQPSERFKMAYLSAAWHRANKSIFSGRMAMPNLYLMKMQKTHNFRGRGVWKMGRRQLGISPRLFIAGEAHVLNTLVHEMCHQAVSEIDKVNDRSEGGHGSNWVAWMRKAGIPPSRYDMTDATEYMSGHEKALKEKQDDAKADAFKGKQHQYSAHEGTVAQFYDAQKMKWIKGVVADFTATKMHFVSDPFSSSWHTLPSKGAGWLYKLDDPTEEKNFKGPEWQRAVERVKGANQSRSHRRASRKAFRNTFGNW